MAAWETKSYGCYEIKKQIFLNSLSCYGMVGRFGGIVSILLGAGLLYLIFTANSTGFLLTILQTELGWVVYLAGGLLIILGFYWLFHKRPYIHPSWR